MKIILALAAAAVILTGSLSAQEMTPAIKAGAKSLNFTFGGLASFGLNGSGVNGGLGASYFTAPDKAIRFGLQANYYHSTTPWNDMTLDHSNPGSDGSSSQISLGAGIDFLVFLNGATSRVRPYYGSGLNIIYHSSDIKYGIPNSAGTGTMLELKNSYSSDGLTYGVSGILGAEFFVYPELSLSAEYKLTVLSVTSRPDAVTIVKNRPDQTLKQGTTYQIFGFGAAGATLHIYF